MAFDEVHHDTITDSSNAGVQELNSYNKVVKTRASVSNLDVAIIMGHHQATDWV